MKRCLLLGLTLGAILPARGFSLFYDANNKPARWDFANVNNENDPGNFNNGSKAIRFWIGSDTASAANRTAELNAIRASFAQWQAIPGTVLKFEEAGVTTTGVDINLDDFRNLVFFAKTNRVNGGRDDITNRIGYTLTFNDPENRILEADIALNAAMFSWSTDFNSTATGAWFVEAVVTHEIGHLLGLDHTPLGGASVINGGSGVGPSAGLSSDEIAAARFLYPASGTLDQLGTISGTVTMNGPGIKGAMVTAETASGITLSATVSRNGGAYLLPALPPGAYNVRVSPLDPDTAGSLQSLFRLGDISSDFGAGTTAFKPTENTATTVAAGGTSTVNFSVAAGEPAFRIQQLSKPTSTPLAPSAIRYAAGLNPGQSYYLGVAGTAIPADATFTISGDGLSIGPMIYEANRLNGNQHLLQAAVTVAANATPGLRTVTVRRGSDLAYANGYFEVMNPQPDYNFDGLNDQFQRQYFPVFTAAEAAPGADPDGDHFSNAYEAATGTVPTNPQSWSFQIDRVEIANRQSRVTWKSDVGKSYQLYGKADVAGAVWTPIGAPITANATTTTQIDVVGGAPKFYKLKLLP